MRKEYLVLCALALSAMAFLLGSAGIFLLIMGSALGFYALVSWEQVKLNQRAYEAEIRNRETDADFRSVVVSKIGVLAYSRGELSFWSKRDLHADQNETLLEDAGQEPSGTGQTLFDVLIKLDRVLIIGGMGSGKSELLKWLTSERSKQGELIILDSHAAPDTWPFGTVIGLGRDYQAIEQAVRGICQEMDNRYKLRSSGQEKAFKPLCMVIDEMTVLNQFADLEKELKSLLCECRKVNIRLIVAGQSDRAGAMGLKGNYDLMTGFEAVCHLEKDGAGSHLGKVFFGRSKVPERFPHPGKFPACNPVNPSDMRFKETSGHGLHSYAQEEKRAETLNYIEYMPSKEGLHPNCEPADPLHGEIVRMWRNQASLNAIARAVFGSAGGVQNRKIKDVLTIYGLL